MFWNSWIGFYNETYLLLGMCVAVNTYCYPLFNTAGNAINTLLSASIGMSILIFPCFTILFYNLPSVYALVRVGDENFMSKCGAVLEGLNFKRQGRTVLYFPFLTMIRKLLLIGILVYMQPYPVLSIFAVNFESVFMIILVGELEPFRSDSANKMEFFNEVFVLVSTYHFYEFTDYMPDVDAREMVGKSLVYLTIINVLVNLGVASMPTLFGFSWSLKLRWKRMKVIKIQKKKRTQRIALQ